MDGESIIATNACKALCQIELIAVCNMGYTDLSPGRGWLGAKLQKPH
jgi:hypothetical protein